jgi:hypothetical protein
MVATPAKHEHPRVLPQRKLKEVRCWSDGCAPGDKRRLLGLYDETTNTLFTHCKCGSWQPIELGSL